MEASRRGDPRKCILPARVLEGTIAESRRVLSESLRPASNDAPPVAPAIVNSNTLARRICGVPLQYLFFASHCGLLILHRWYDHDAATTRGWLLYQRLGDHSDRIGVTCDNARNGCSPRASLLFPRYMTRN